MADVSVSGPSARPDPGGEAVGDRGRGGPLRRFWAFGTRHPISTVLLVACVVRVAICVYVFITKGGALFGDETTYSGLAAMAADGQTGTWDAFIRGLYWRTGTFILPLTWLFKIFGPNSLVGQLLASAFAAVAAVFTVLLARRITRPTFALGAGLLVALLPSQVLFSTLILKDSATWAVLAALALVVASSAGAKGRRLIVLTLGTAVLLFLLGHLREHTLVVCTWAVLGAAVVHPVGRRWRIAGALVVAIVVPAWVGVGPFGISLIRDHGSLAQRRADNAEGASTAFVSDSTAGDLRSAEAAAQALQQRLQRLTEKADALRTAAQAAAGRAAAIQAGGGDGQEQDVGRLNEDAARLTREASAADAAARQRGIELADAAAAVQRARLRAQRSAGAKPGRDLGGSFGEVGATSSNLRLLPVGVRVMLLDPLPWVSTSNLRVRLAQAETVLWYPMLALALVGIVTSRRRLDVITFPVLSIGGIVLMYALSEGNFGTAYRHRGETVWAMALLAGVGLEWLVDRRRSRSVLPIGPREALSDH